MFCCGLPRQVQKSSLCSRKAFAITVTYGVWATLYIPLPILYCRWTCTLLSGEEAKRIQKVFAMIARRIPWRHECSKSPLSTLPTPTAPIRSCCWLLNHTEFHVPGEGVYRSKHSRWALRGSASETRDHSIWKKENDTLTWHLPHSWGRSCGKTFSDCGARMVQGNDFTYFMEIASFLNLEGHSFASYAYEYAMRHVISCHLLVLICH